MIATKRKGQIQLGETVAIVIILIILLIIGLVVWNRFSQEDIKPQIREFQELTVVELSKTVSELPEIRCSSAAVTSANCLEWYKLVAFNYTISSAATRNQMMDFYNGYFGRSKITIYEVYPNIRNITIYNYNLSNTTTLLIKIPVVIQDDVIGTRGIGYISVEGYY